MKNLCFFTFLLFLVIGCSKSPSGQAPVVSASRGNPLLLKTQLDDIYNSPWLTSCETKNQDAIADLVNTLDSHYFEIRRYSETPVDNVYLRRFQLGPLWLREIKEIPKPEDKWSSDNESWQDILSNFKEIASTPVDGKWAAVYKSAQYLLSMDIDRLLNNVNAELDKDSGPLLKEASFTIQYCLDQPECVDPSFEPSIKQFIASNTTFRWISDELVKTVGTENKRELLIKFKDRIDTDYHRIFGFDKVQTVKRISLSTFEIAMNSGDLKGYEKEIEKLILPFWTNDQYKVIINWSSLGPSHKLELGKDLYGRPSTNDERTVIYNNTTTKALPHEFGHALGFSDVYYLTWKPTECIYTEQYNSAEIMSDSLSGRVTESDWNQLDQAYPFIPE